MWRRVCKALTAMEGALSGKEQHEADSIGDMRVGTL